MEEEGLQATKHNKIFISQPGHLEMKQLEKKLKMLAKLEYNENYSRDYVKEVMKEVVFSINGKEVLSYDFVNEFEGEREATIKQLAEENKCNEKDIKCVLQHILNYSKGIKSNCYPIAAKVADFICTSNFLTLINPKKDGQ